MEEVISNSPQVNATVIASSSSSSSYPAVHLRHPDEIDADDYQADLNTNEEFSASAVEITEEIREDIDDDSSISFEFGIVSNKRQRVEASVDAISVMPSSSMPMIEPVTQATESSSSSSNIRASSSKWKSRIQQRAIRVKEEAKDQLEDDAYIPVHSGFQSRSYNIIFKSISP